MQDAALPEVYQLINEVLHYQLFSVDQTPITVSSLVIFLVLFTALVLVSRLVSRLILARTLRRLKIDETKSYTIRRITYYLLVLLSAIFSFQFIGIDLGGLAVIFGLLSVGIGFGLQNITANFIAGIVLLFERPIRIGDRITVGDTLGDVIAINMRSTTIRSLQNIAIIVPNSEFVSTQVVNWSHSDLKVRLDLEVGVSYGSDLDAVLQSLREVAEENPRVMKSPPPEVLHRGFGDSAWNMELRVWIQSPEFQFTVESELYCAVVRKFRERGVEIPFPQRDLHVRSPLPVPIGSGESGDARAASA
ncbi:mechanosensitive ion channel [candidate division GN15 bacterium]|nr:mechanosensitive ion channel [candidate division GN15 bacterium]